MLHFYSEVVNLNEKNLIPFSERTESEQREIRSKGGKASGVARGFRSALKSRLKAHPELYGSIIDTLTDKALSGDLKAVEMLVDLVGESVQRENLKLKRKELALKEKEQNGNVNQTEVIFIEDVKE